MAININQIRKDLRVPLLSLSNLAYGSALSSFKSKKKFIINQFKEHKVSQEIKGGNSVESSFLPKGNLFALLGFYDGSHPVDDLEDFLEENITLERDPSINYNGNQIVYNFNVSMPTSRELREVTPLTWDESRSWLDEIENGVSGLTRFIFYKYFSTDSSRSKSGLQSKGRGSDYVNYARPISYLNDLLANFKREFK